MDHRTDARRRLDLQQEDLTSVRQFKDPKPHRQARRDLRLGTAMGLLMLLTALCLSCWTSPWER